MQKYKSSPTVNNANEVSLADTNVSVASIFPVHFGVRELIQHNQLSKMEPRKLFNSDQIGLSNYNKMEEEHSAQGDLNNLSQSTIRLNIRDEEPVKKCCVCLPPHKWRLDECCCGCTLRVATLLIGWFYMVGSSILLFGFFYIPGSIFRWEDVLFTGVKLISSIILLIGVYKELYFAIKGAAILYLIDLIVEIILGIVLTVQMGDVFPIVVLLVGLPLGVYFLVVVNSFAVEVASGNVKRNFIV